MGSYHLAEIDLVQEPGEVKISVARMAVFLYTVNPRISPPGGLFIFDAFWVGAYSRGAYKII